MNQAFMSDIYLLKMQLKLKIIHVKMEQLVPNTLSAAISSFFLSSIKKG